MKNKKLRVTSAQIIVTGTKEKPYYEIKYREVGKENYCIGYSSYCLDNVFEWLEECFDLVEDKNVEQRWIPVAERLPEDGTYLTTLDGELVGQEEPFTGMCGIENGKWDEDGCQCQSRTGKVRAYEQSRDNIKAQTFEDLVRNEL